MRFFLDANLPVTLLATMRAAYPVHHFENAHGHGLAAEDDEPLLMRAAELKADVFVTADLRQMHRPGERSACRDAGLHWVGMQQPAGADSLTAVAALTSPFLNAVPILMEEVAAATAPTSFLLKGHGRQRGQIFTKKPEHV